MKNQLTILLLFIVPFISFAQEDYTKVGYKQTGMASFYANKFHGRKTASGEKFNMYAMTAAHPKIPFNSIVKVTNKKNGKWVTLRINDRGPFTTRRIIDVSKAAALKLDMVRDGVVEVEVELLKTEGQEEEKVVTKSEPEKEEKKETVAKTETKTTTQSKEEEKDKKTTSSNSSSTKEKIVEKTKKTVDKATEAISKVAEKAGEKINKTVNTTINKKGIPKDVLSKKKSEPLTLEEQFKPSGTYSVWGSKKQGSGYGIQLGSYSDVEVAVERGKEAIDLGLKDIYIQSGWTNGKVTYRVLFASKPSQEELQTMIPIAISKGFSGAFVKKHF